MKAAVLLPRLRSVALAVVALAALACSAAPGAKKDPLDPGFGGGDNEKPLDPPRNPDTVNDDGGAFDLGGRMSDGMGEAGRPPETDAGASSPDSGKPSNLCQGSVGAGDFKVVEIMIASIAGSGDKGEWIELQSTRSCTQNAKGLVITSPRGVGTDTATVGADMFVPAYGTFVVANSTNTAVNHGLGARVVAFSGEPADVLKNDGDTITVTNGATTVDTLTYPKFGNLVAGSSVSFPWDCAWSDRTDWQRWSYSFTTYGGGAFKGTPNDDNLDVACY
jgi:hypothetical protein